MASSRWTAWNNSVSRTVVAAAGHGFDEAAAAAARSFVFEPARRGDTPIASSVSYRYAFRLHAPAPDVPPPKAGANGDNGYGKDQKEPDRAAKHRGP